MKTSKNGITKFLMLLAILLLSLSTVSAGEAVSVDEAVSVNEVVIVEDVSDAYVGMDQQSGEVEINHVFEEVPTHEDIQIDESSIVFQDNYNEDEAVIEYFEPSCDLPQANYNNAEYSNHVDESILEKSLICILNETYSEDIILDSTSNDTAVGNNFSYIYNFDAFLLMDIMMEHNVVEPVDFSDNVFKFVEFKDLHLLNHGILIFTPNDYLYHEISEIIVICSNKTNGNYAYCIDNSIVGSDLTIIFIPKSFFITSYSISIQFINIYQAFFPNYFQFNSMRGKI